MSQRIAVRRLDLDDACAETEQLPARVRARQVAGEIGHGRPAKRLHRG
jgi:hypothetical protein